MNARTTALVALASAISTTAWARQPAITSYTIDSGGGVSSGSIYVITGTFGQPDATPAAALAADPYTMTGGYWGGLPLCPADLNGDGLVDFADYLEFLNYYDAQDPRVDFNHDGFVDFIDYLEFLNFYDAGC